jgi:acetyltransferase-like isoleucine patch superfamily enzyme
MRVGKVKEHKLIGKLSLYFQYLLGNISLSGNNNKLLCLEGAIFWNNKISVKGNNNKIVIDKRASLKNVTINISGSNSLIEIGEDVSFYEKGNLLIEGNDAYIKIGKKTTFGEVKLFVGEGFSGITIGENCMISRDVAMNTSDFHSIIDIEKGKRINPPKSIKVGNHVWVGNGAYVAKGAEIGNDCVIASRAYVGGKQFESNVIIAGIPAKEIKRGISWDRAKLPY